MNVFEQLALVFGKPSPRAPFICLGIFFMLPEFVYALAYWAYYAFGIDQSESFFTGIGVMFILICTSVSKVLANIGGFLSSRLV